MLGVAAALLISVGGYFGFNHSKNQDEKATANKDSVAAVVLDSGFAAKVKVPL